MLTSFVFNFFLLIYDSHTEREREAETQAEGEAGSMHREPDVGLDPGSPGSRPRPKAGAKPLRHPGIPSSSKFSHLYATNTVKFSVFFIFIFFPKSLLPYTKK